MHKGLSLCPPCPVRIHPSFCFPRTSHIEPWPDRVAVRVRAAHAHHPPQNAPDLIRQVQDSAPFSPPRSLLHLVLPVTAHCDQMPWTWTTTMVTAEATEKDILRPLAINLQIGTEKERGRDTTETVQVRIVAIAGTAVETEKTEIEVDTETASTIATEIAMHASDPGSGITEARTGPDPRMALATTTLQERVFNTTALRDRIQADRRQSQMKTATRRLPQDSPLFSLCPWCHLSQSHW